MPTATKDNQRLVDAYLDWQSSTRNCSPHTYAAYSGTLNKLVAHLDPHHWVRRRWGTWKRSWSALGRDGARTMYEGRWWWVRRRPADEISPS